MGPDTLVVCMRVSDDRVLNDLAAILCVPLRVVELVERIGCEAERLSKGGTKLAGKVGDLGLVQLEGIAEAWDGRFFRPLETCAVE